MNKIILNLGPISTMICVTARNLDSRELKFLIINILAAKIMYYTVYILYRS